MLRINHIAGMFHDKYNLQSVYDQLRHTSRSYRWVQDILRKDSPCYPCRIITEIRTTEMPLALMHCDYRCATLAVCS